MRKPSMRFTGTSLAPLRHVRVGVWASMEVGRPLDRSGESAWPGAAIRPLGIVRDEGRTWEPPPVRVFAGMFIVLLREMLPEFWKKRLLRSEVGEVLVGLRELVEGVNEIYGRELFAIALSNRDFISGGMGTLWTI